MTFLVPGKLDRYWVFAGYDFYPFGGINDLKQSFQTYSEAREFCRAKMENDVEWVQIFDSETRTVCFQDPVNGPGYTALYRKG